MQSKSIRMLLPTGGKSHQINTLGIPNLWELQKKVFGHFLRNVCNQTILLFLLTWLILRKYLQYLREKALTKLKDL